jgi:hypothetical protein
LVVAPDIFLNDSEEPERLPSLSTWKIDHKENQTSTFQHVTCLENPI